jgi:hypothetical protein
MVGDFGAVEGEPRPGVALLLPDGKLDPAFVPWRGETNAGLSRALGDLRHATITGDGKVWIQGSRRQPTYSVESWVYQLSSDGSVADVRQCDASVLGLPGPLVWVLPPGGFCLHRPIDWSRTGPSEPVIAPPRPPDMAGWFAQGPFSGTQASGALQRIFASVPLEMCPYAVRLPDGGAILLVQDGDAGRLMRFDKDWRPDLSYTNGLRTKDGLRLALQRDGKLLVARSNDLHDIAGTDIGSVVRLNVDGTIDRTFRCETDERVLCVAAQPDGRVVIGGFFRRVNGIYSLSLARLWPDGSLDKGFLAHFKNPQALFASRRVPVRRLVLVAGSAAGGGSSAKPGTEPAPSSPAQSVLINSLSVAGGAATVQFQGSPRQIYILQAADRLAESAWMNVNTNQTDASGVGWFREEGITNSVIRFYRVASPH